jgi:hypothetical protein
MLDPDLTGAPTSGDVTFGSKGTNNKSYWYNVWDIMGVSQLSELQNKLKLTGGTITANVSTNKSISVTVTYSGDNAKYTFTVE